jgi:hypothetical protein
MIDAAEWQKNNEAYLAAAFQWLRLCLTSLAPPPAVIIQDEPLPVNNYQAPEQLHWNIFRKQKTTVRMPIAELGSPDPNDLLAAQIADAAAALDEAEQVEPPPALVILRARLGLSRFEEQVLLFCAALELDTSVAALCARAHDDARKPYPTFALALAIFDEPAWDALSAQRPLRYLRLIEINQPAAHPLTASALRIDERVLNFIKGLNEFDERLAPLLNVIEPPELDLPPSQEKIAEAILLEIQHSAANAARVPLIELTGIDGASKQFIAAQIVSTLQMQLYRLPAEALPADAAELETLARLWQRETLLKPVALYLDASELNTEPNSTAALRRFSAQCEGVTFLDTRAAWNADGDNLVVFDVESPTPFEQKTAWSMQLSAANDETDDETGDGETDDEGIAFFGAQLANQFNLSLPAIHRIARNALAHSSEKASLREVAWELCLAGARPHLDTLAQRIEPKATPDTLVLPEEEAALLRQIVEQVRRRGMVYDNWGFRERMNRGLGISALFAGESGTGKTMAAEVLARELRLNLYRIDLSAVVSKFIGETEKNLRRLFDAAEDGGTILFFDEADALFGKRSEVKDSHDRYANIEINYLLQRLESYRGLAILATNMKSSLDAAFMRRLRFIVNFPFPGVAERAQIWRKVFPPATPTGELDYERLARFNLSGGSINNIALNAAFRAANRNPPRVTMEMIFDAVRAEFRKLDRPINEKDFAPVSR